ncbi:MAG: hypothetical protein SFX19_08245 [Alphaproteobacteria bacterium]|nr:hypothetical protein [Alphaproteobacteria bacterium]
MDNKTFVAKFVAEESERLNQGLKGMLAKGEAPSDAEKDALFSDMEATLKKLTGALEFLTANMDTLTDEEEEDEVPVA